MFDYDNNRRTEPSSLNGNNSDEELPHHTGTSLEINNSNNNEDDDELASLDVFRSHQNFFRKFLFNVLNVSGPSKLPILILGQGISFLLAGAGAAQATLHLDCNLSVPTLSTAFVYFSLTFLLIPFYYRERRKQKQLRVSPNKNKDSVLGDNTMSPERRIHLPVPVPVSPSYSLFGVVPLSSPLWAYFLIAFLDVEANYVTVLAFQYTTLTSVNLCDALAIPSAMLFSKIILSRSYVKVHVIGATICMIGILVNVTNDYNNNNNNNKEDKEYPHRTIGDVLAISGGLVWGANNVVQEYAIRSCGMPLEFLGMLGLFGSLISIVQMAAFERNDVILLFLNNNNGGNTPSCPMEDKVLLIIGYVGPCLGMYVGGTFFLLYSEAALYNLSLLTSDFWAVLFSVLAERIVPKPLFFVALVMTVTGVIVYEKGPSPIIELPYNRTTALETSINNISELNSTSSELGTNGGTEWMAPSTIIS